MMIVFVVLVSYVIESILSEIRIQKPEISGKDMERRSEVKDGMTYDDARQVRKKHPFIFVVPLVHLCKVLLEVIDDGFEFHRTVTI